MSLLMDQKHTLSPVHWIASHNLLPHCKNAKSLSALRSGIAIAEIMTETLPNSCHHLFLPKIQVCNLTVQKCISNLRVILHTLQICFRNNPNLNLSQYTGQGLFYEQKLLQKFVNSILMKLSDLQINIDKADEYAGEISRNYVQLVQEEAKSSKRTFNPFHRVQINDLSSIIQSTDEAQPQEKNNNIQIEPDFTDATFPNSKMQKLVAWINRSFPINPNQLKSEELLGELVNCIFAGGRLRDAERIIKPSHYQMGALAVYRKISEYLLQCQRLKKVNLTELSQDVEKGYISEKNYWGLIEDIWAFRNNRNSSADSISKGDSLKKPMKHVQKENICVPADYPNVDHNDTSLEQVDQCNAKPSAPEYAHSVITAAEKWIINELGCGHSLNKGRTQPRKRRNPLFNGVLIGSIIMRLKIGKVKVIKQPISRQQVQDNITQIANALLQRGYECSRKFFLYTPSYNLYLGIIWQIKTAHDVKHTAIRNKISDEEKERRIQAKCLQIDQKEKDSIRQWLQSAKNIEVGEFPYLTIAKLTEFCSETFGLSLYRETTSKIRERNVVKILQQLRRMGICQHPQLLDKAQVLHQNDNIRWNIVKALRQTLQNRIQYHRVHPI